MMLALSPLPFGITKKTGFPTSLRTAVLLLVCSFLLFLTMLGCSLRDGQAVRPAFAGAVSSGAMIEPVTRNDVEGLGEEEYPALSRLAAAYPDVGFALTEDALVIDGEHRVPRDTVLEQLAADYPAFAPIDVPDADPGRVRSEAFFAALYGRNRQAVRDHLEAVTWLPGVDGTTIWMSSKHGAADALRRVSQELLRLPSLHRYLVEPAGGFVYRTIAGTTNLSAHSWGIAVDIGLRFADYWRWGLPLDDRAATPADPAAPPAPPYRNRVPSQIVEVFERNGFIWGGRWEHYDTMHFEYRPELIDQQHAPRRRFIGESVEERIIEVHRFGSGPMHLVLVGGIHGAYEWNSVELMHALLEHWSEWPLFAEGVTIHVVPTMNPDARQSRVNSRGVDLNRNWRTPDWTAHPPAGGGVLWAEGGAEPFSEPETRAVSDYLTGLQAAGPNRTISVHVLFFHALLRPGLYEHRGLALPGYTELGGIDPSAARTATEYALSTGYRYADRFTGGYTTTGEAIHWCALAGIHAVDIELPDTDDPFAKPLVYELSHFQSALVGVEALIDILSDTYTAFRER